MTPRSPEFGPPAPTTLGYLIPVLICFALYAAGWWAVGGYPFAHAIYGHVSLLTPPLFVCGVILLRRSRWFGCQRLFWDTFGIGMALWIIGHLGWAFDELLLGRRQWLQWHTVFSLCGGIGPLIALMARPARGVWAAAVGSVSVVLACYGLLAIFLYSYFALIPSLVLSEPDAEVGLLAIVQVHRALLFAGMLAGWWMARRTSWREAFVWLAVGTGIGFFLRLLTSLAIVQGQYKSGTLYDLAWIAPFVCYAVAALAAPDSPSGDEPEPRASGTSRDTALSAIPVLLIPIVGYATPSVFSLGGSADSFRALLTGVMTVAGLGMLTVRLALQQGQILRGDARIRRLAAAIEQTGDMVLIAQVSGTVEHANDAFLRATGYSRADVARLRFADLIVWGGPSGGAEVGEAVRERGMWRGTRTRRRRDGSSFPVSCTFVGLKDRSGALSHFVAVERDVSEDLRLRDQLVHSERLSAIGELVAGVAHEINNPLQAIVGCTELMLEEATGSALAPDLEVVRREATRAGQIVRNLLSFVRRGAPNRTPEDLNEIVRMTVSLREFHLQQRSIQCLLDLDPGPVPVLVNRDEVQQVVLNLVLNAEQAILSAADGGNISIRSRAGRQAHTVEVADSGPGIDPEHRGRIFEPFFTTKGVGKGTGLGLSISHGIALSHGGSLELCPTESGACFRLTIPSLPAATLPVSSGAEPAAVTEAVPRTSAGAGNGVALVLVDAAQIRTRLSGMLSGLGFEVIHSDTAEEALRLVEREPRVSVVFCDVRMPGMAGVEFHRRLVARQPALGRRFVFITGDRAALGDEEIGDGAVLEEPFTGGDLRDALARVGAVT